MQIKPTEGMVAVKFVDELDDEPATMAYPGETVDYEGLLAIVVGVGPKAKVKKGDVVVCQPYARSGLCLDGVYLIEGYQIAATLS